MKSTLAIIAVSTILLTGCTDTKPEPLPSGPVVSVSPSETVSEGSTPTPEPTANPTPRPTEPENTVTPKPTTPNPSTTEAGTDGNSFVARWIPRFLQEGEEANTVAPRILKAANGTCEVISGAGGNWESNQEVIDHIASELAAQSLSSNQLLEFAQDAEQNYCAGRP